MDIISKKEAKENGFSFYFTGKVCRNGGAAPRRVSNNQCTCENCKKIKSEREVEYRQRPEVKERHRIQSRNWYHNNSEMHTNSWGLQP